MPEQKEVYMSLWGIVLLVVLIGAFIVFLLIEIEDNKTASKPPTGPHPWLPPESMPEAPEPASESTSTCKDRI